MKELVRGSVEETLNELLEQEAEKLTQVARYERNEARQGLYIFAQYIQVFLIRKYPIPCCIGGFAENT